jgi:PAS domain S-box-containing protein
VTAPAVVRADHAVARILAVTDVDDVLYPRVLEAIGDALDWDVGALWEVPPADHDALNCAELWYAPDFPSPEFVDITRATSLPMGTGLPGRVWQTGEPAWIASIGRDANFPRADAAARAGLRSGMAFPVAGPRGVRAVIEFFSREPRSPDDDLLATMASLGSQIAQFLERRRAEREAGELKRAMLEAALDCMITIDNRGRVLDFNRAAERTFGYRTDQVLGVDMADLIVPPSLRERHHEGLERYLTTGESRILGRRVEVTGMRADGSEFPVELTITRIDLPGPARFVGYLRDITERKESEAELLASRRRIVDAADDARRRLERDLHDGAQQQLVNLVLTLRLARAKMSEDSDAEALALVDEAIEELGGATAALRELARGIHPMVLSDGGLEPALNGLAHRSKVPVEIVEAPLDRFPERVEATAYFLVAEAMTNVIRYSGASQARVAVRRDGARLHVEVSDDGRGGASVGEGSGLRGLADRIAALDGEFEVVSPEGGGTVVKARIPCA